MPTSISQVTYQYFRFRHIGLDSAWTPDSPRRLERCPGKMMDKYTKRDAIFDVLKVRDTILIRGSWMIERSRQGLTLPRRQDLPECAIWNPLQLQQRGVDHGDVDMLAVSYCWHQPENPDPNGIQLGIVARVMKQKPTLLLMNLGFFICHI